MKIDDENNLEGNDETSRRCFGFAFVPPKIKFENDSEIASWAKAVVQQMDHEVFVADKDLKLGCFLAASSVVGPDTNRIATMLSVPSTLAEAWAENLRRSRLWLESKVCCEHWFDWMIGAMLFIADFLVASGALERRFNDSGQGFYYPVAGCQ